MAVTQDTHRISITTPLGKDVLLLRGFSGSEAISQLFHFDLELLSENDSIKFPDVVGKNVTLHVNTVEGGKRHFNGFLSRFSQGPQERRLTAYHAQMVPWLWFLTRTADCRIFQNQKVPDIIQKIFADLKFHDFELRLSGTYTPREYCVQYRETDFNFVSRLMEEEGISYFFDHQDGKHVLVLADDTSAYKPCPNQETARYSFRGPGATYEEDLVTEWHYHEEFRTGAWAQTDYNFETPSTSLAVSVNGKNPYEIYEYPGEHNIRSLGDRLAKIRLQEQTVPCAVSHGASMCRNFRSGFQFTLKEHYRSDLNQKYLITALRHTATRGANYEVGAAGGDNLTYHNNFETVPAATLFRPPRVTPTPFVQGCQTAVVVGPAGEEIYTDKYGRVKAQFHWDREGKKNENSSCWIRVSHPWAGQGWGAVSIPRIGQEVIVDFLEGDPDQPIIVGRVYNAEQMPPFGMPGGAVVSGVKSNSTKGGGGYNEISLNDTKGKELIQVHGQYDMDSKIEHDERLHVINNRTKNVDVNETSTIGNNRTEKVGVNETITIGSNRTEKVGANETITIGANRKESVAANETIDIGASRTETVGSNESIAVALMRTRSVGINEMINIGAAQEVTVGGLQMISVGAVRMLNVGLSQSTSVGTSMKQTIGTSFTQTVGTSSTYTIGSSLTEKIGSDQNTKVGSNRAVDVGSNDSLKVTSKLTIEVGSEIVLKTGSSSITMKSGGDIEIKGVKIAIEGSSKISQKGAVISAEADGKNTVKGGMVDVEADGVTTVKGSLVRIN